MTRDADNQPEQTRLVPLASVVWLIRNYGGVTWEVGAGPSPGGDWVTKGELVDALGQQFDAPPIPEEVPE